VYSPGKVPCKADISTFIDLSVATDGSNLCNIYSTDKSKNGHHMKIPNGPYTARDPFMLKHQESIHYQIKKRSQVGKHIIKQGTGKGPPYYT
jgi:hypothetical protein